MKFFAFVVFAQAVFFQAAYSQCIRPYGPRVVAPVAAPLMAPAPILSPAVLPAPTIVPAMSPVAIPSVANSLADTLSLLTVSSLLADTLPLSYPNVVTSLPMVGGCGCGLGPIYY
ncbi:alpha-amylase-like [Galleria mellonella]|uniref:Alpha-amylase-like n=1 Tax=Galleria mellonella TaxID=7137 RepID=A0A6J3CGW1_GALME|nr:alpha-amylase-like [Galleria mellonella]